MQLFYDPNFFQNKYLNEVDSKHCIQVLRNKKGDSIWITDGKGNVYEGIIEDADPKRCTINIKNSIKKEPSNRFIELAICPTKNSDRLEYLIEKATEIGVNSIQLILSQNSERRVQKIERLEKKAISAIKQSVQFYLPKIHPLTSFKEFIEHCKLESKLIAHLSENSVGLNTIKLGKSVSVLIGPEGDFTQQEINFALENGFTEISLGTNRLRTETAGIHAVSILNLI